jgi:hypothetical protein
LKHITLTLQLKPCEQLTLFNNFIYVLTFNLIDILCCTKPNHVTKNDPWRWRQVGGIFFVFYRIKILVCFVHCWHCYTIYSVKQRHDTTPTALAQLHTVNSAKASYHAIVLMHFYAVNSAANIYAVKMEQQRTPILTPSISAIVF